MPNATQKCARYGCQCKFQDVKPEVAYLPQWQLRAGTKLDVDVMNAETIITIVVIKIMRDGVRGVYEGWLQPPLNI